MAPVEVGCGVGSYCGSITSRKPLQSPGKDGSSSSRLKDGKESGVTAKHSPVARPVGNSGDLAKVLKCLTMN